jgi:hypothetical protein
MGPGVVGYKRNWTDDTYATLQVEAFSKGLYPQLVAKLNYQLIPTLKQSPLGKWLAERGRKSEAAKYSEAEKPADPENSSEPKKEAVKNESANHRETEKECPTVKSES